MTVHTYDAAGRLVKEGDKVYSYGWLDKILSVQENGKQTASFEYQMDGQIASATTATGTENFSWDGLALIHRGKTAYVNEPYMTGGNPVLAFDPEKTSGPESKVLFTDILGTTLGAKEGDQFNRSSLTAFGESSNASFSTENAFFTGKPYIGELGYAFLFRNYRAEQGKWQTADPLGYPDGWNNSAYCNNFATDSIDPLGLSVWQWTKETLAALSYGILYIYNASSQGSLAKWFFGPGAIPAGIASLYTASAVQNMSSVTNAIDSFFNNAIASYNNKSSIGTYALSSQSFSISNNQNTAWGAIVGTSTLTISGNAVVTKSSDGGRDVVINLSCRFFDDIDWKSYEELVVDHNGSFSGWGVTSYIEGALDVWLDKGLQARYNVDASWTKQLSKHFAE